MTILVREIESDSGSGVRVLTDPADCGLSKERIEATG